MNIVDLIKNNLSGSVLGQLGSLIGASPEQTKAATDAAIPSVLGGLGKMAGTKEGADRLSDMLSKLDPNMVNNMGGMFGGGNAGAVGEQGAGMLDKILGGGLLGSLGGLLGKFTGMGGGMIQKLLGFLAPLIMGTIAKSLGGKPSGQGLTQFFAEQKSNIASAMPAGLSLGSLPGMGDIGAAAQKMAGSVKQGASQLTWLLPVLLVALGIVLWFYFKPEEKMNLPAATDLGKNIAKAAEPGLTEEIKGFFESATTTFNGIKDAASADSALPKIKELDGKVDMLKKGFALVPEAGKGAIKTLLSGGIEKLKAMVEKLLALPGVGEKLKPVVEPLMAKLAAVAG